MIVTIYKHHLDTTPYPQEMTWETFIHQPEIATHALHYAKKDAVPLISPAEIFEGQTRANCNVKGIHFLLFDIDKVAPEVVEQITDNLIKLGVAFRLYSTWSHAENLELHGTASFRVMIPITRIIQNAEWLKAMPLLVRKLLLGNFDKKTKDSSRMYFLPSAPAGTKPEHLINFYVEGNPFDVDSLQIETSPIIQMPDRSLLVPEIQAKIAELARKPKQAVYREFLKKMLAGEALGTAGERHGTLLDLTWGMVRDWPDASADSIVMLLMPSLKLMAKEDTKPRDWEREAHRLVTSAQQKREEERISNENKAANEQRQAIARAIPGRTTPYTAEELAEWGINRHHWILQYGNWYHFFVDGRYNPRAFSKDEVVNVARDLLAPAASVGVELMKPTKDGFATKTLGEITHDYGTVVERFERSLIAQESTFDGKKFVLATCPRRPIEPQFSEAVDRWLQVFAGEKYEKILDWIAVATRQEEACASLFVRGAEGSAKSLLALGLSRIWTDEGPVKLSVALGEGFNADMMRCPLILGDEKMPTNNKGQPRTEELRSLITEGHHQFRQKYRDDATLRGNARVILTANNEEMLRTAQALTNDDIQAISKRILAIHVSEAARLYVEELTYEQRGALLDAIAPHALWLAANRTVTRGMRFIVDGDGEAARSMIVSAGLRGPLLHWATTFIINPRHAHTLLVQKSMGGWICVRNKKLHISTPALLEVWEVYTTNRKPPEIRELSQALRGVSEKDQKQLRIKTATGEEIRKWVWVIDTANLLRWAEDFGSVDEVKAALDVFEEQQLMEEGKKVN